MLFDDVETPGTLTVDDLRRYRGTVAALLADAGVPAPERDAEALLAYALRRPFIDWDELPATGPAVDDDSLLDLLVDLPELVERRQAREPLQRIIGYTVFRHVTLVVSEDDDVSVPRPDSEVVAQIAIDEAARVVAEGREPLVVDLCCGAGPIGVSVDVEVPGSRVVSVDVSAEAVGHAGHNAGACGTLDHRTLLGDVTDPALLAELDGTVDVVVSNPPCYTPETVPDLPEIRDHEPALALYGGGADGLDVARAVLATARRLLRPDGLLVLQHTAEQADAAKAAAEATGGFVVVTGAPDRAQDRAHVLVARRVS